MFWNRKKRNQEKERKTVEEVRSGDKPEHEPDISEPIKAFLAASDRWDTDFRVDGSMYIRSAIDPDTSLRLEVVGEIGFSGDIFAFCTNHEWVTRDEAIAVLREIQSLENKRRDVRICEDRQKWTEAYKNRGEVV